jgi:large subunit ribosomal protein L29
VRGSEVHNMRDEELVEFIRTSREEQFGLRLQHATGELENTARLGGVRRDVARALTVAKERGIDLDRELRD